MLKTLNNKKNRKKRFIKIKMLNLSIALPNQ